MKIVSNERTLSDDEISELAECLWDACKEAEAGGAQVTVTVMITKATMCPFGALLGGKVGFPGPTTVAQATGIPRADVDAFMRGFSDRGHAERRPSAMAELGARFRQQAEEGGFASS